MTSNALRLSFTKTVNQEALKRIGVGEAQAATELFNQAMSEGWNLEMDWLWLATKVTLDSQRRTCLEQALYINPQSRLAKRALKRLKKNPDQPLNFC